MKIEDDSKLKNILKEGIYGKADIKKSERNYYLGELEERVLRYLTYEQVMEAGIYPEILTVIKDRRAKKLIIDRKVDLQSAHDYIDLALKNDLSFKKIDSPEFKGSIALVVVSDQAVEVQERKVLSRKERLQSKGISDKIIRNVGSKLCQECWNFLAKNAPEELVNYQQMNLLDKLIGTKCVCNK